MKKRTRKYILVSIATAIILWSALPFFFRKPPQYKIVDLGNFGLEHIEPHAINDYGQIVGHFSPANGLLYGSSRAFVYDDVNGFNEIDKSCVSIWALDINNRGQVVGRDPTSPVLFEGYLFLSDPESGTIDIIVGETGTIAAAGNIEINNKGRVVGTIRKSNPALCEAFIWDKEKGFTFLGTLGGNGIGANAINDKGQIVGSSQTADEESHAFIFDDVNGMTDIGTPGEKTNAAFAINNRSQVMGFSLDYKRNRSIVIWDANNTMRRIEMGKQSWVWLITLNDNGQFIGTYKRKKSILGTVNRWLFRKKGRPKAYPFAWSQQQGFVDIGLVLEANYQWHDFHIRDINNKGQILGYGTRRDGQRHIFILQPKKKKSNK